MIIMYKKNKSLNKYKFYISETYYRIENKKWFTFVMLFTAFTLLPCALEISTDDSRFFVFSKRSRYNYCGGITEFYKR